MSHKDDCYSPDYARERGREDWRTGWNSPYAMGDCYEAQQAYDEGVRAEQRADQHRYEMRQQEEAAEMEYYALAEAERRYWEDVERQETEQMERDYEAQMEAEQAESDLAAREGK